MLFSLEDARSDARFDAERDRQDRTGHEYDPMIGFIPTPGFSGLVDQSGRLVRVTFDTEGIRDNGNAPEGLNEGAILVVGDSFAFGSEVNDDETWPALLEASLGRRVLNAGVAGYGLDQAILRAERILNGNDGPESPKIDTVVLALIAHDIIRCGMSEFYAPKPYFEAQNGRLELKNTPVPRPENPDSLLRRLLGRSHLMDFILRRAAPEWWSTSRYRMAHRDFENVAILLMDRFSEIAERHGVRPIVVNFPMWFEGEYRFRDYRVDDIQRIVGPVLERAREQGMEVLDIAPQMNRMIETTGRERREWFHRYHFTKETNSWAATQIESTFFTQKQSQGSP